MKRYFIITFQSQDTTGTYCHEGYEYPNEKEIIEGLQALYNSDENYVLTNIRELSKKDFESYIKL